MIEKSQTQIDTERADSMLNENRDDSFYKFPSKLREAWSSSQSESYAPMSYMEFDADKATGSGAVELYAFKVVDDGDGTVSVTSGTVNTVTTTNLTPTGKPTQLWLKVIFNNDEVAVATVNTSGGSTTEVTDYRQIATITWDGDTPTIVQGIKGNQSIASCGVTHQWGTLYS